MKKRIIPILLLSILLLMGIWLVVSNNELRRLDNAINQHWTLVEDTYRNRTDLVPSLTTAAKDYVEFEAETLRRVQLANQEAQVTPRSGSEITQHYINHFQVQQNELSEAILEFLEVVDKYPYLKEYDAFKTSLERLHSTNDSISLLQSKYNERVGLYNIELQVFPKDVLSSILGYNTRGFFEGIAEARSTDQ